MPGLDIPSVGVAVDVADLDRALNALRADHVIALGRDGRVVCDLRSVDPADDERLGDVLGAIS